MKRLVIAIAALTLANPAFAGSYRVVLQPVDGKMLVGHAGVQAVDATSAVAHVRLITPGNQVKQRGTIRVLVRNLGPTTFPFGPDNVRLELADGTELKPTSLDMFERGATIVQREMNREAAVDMQVRNSLSSYAQQGSGSTLTSTRPEAFAPGPNLEALSRRTDESDLPAAKTVDALYQLLLPEDVGPDQAWGGYYVFDLPKVVFDRRIDQPLTVIVRTGSEEHRFAATLHWK